MKLFISIVGAGNSETLKGLIQRYSSKITLLTWQFFKQLFQISPCAVLYKTEQYIIKSASHPFTNVFLKMIKQNSTLLNLKSETCISKERPERQVLQCAGWDAAVQLLSAAVVVEKVVVELVPEKET